LLPEGIDGSFGGFAEQRFKFGKELLDRVEVGKLLRRAVLTHIGDG
jgi:hypothetical protein